MRLLVIILSIVGFVALALLGYGFRTLEGTLGAPAAAGGTAEVVEIPRGANLEAAMAILRDRGLATQSSVLDLYVRHLHQRGEIKPGEYSVSPTMTPVQQIELLESGNVVTYTIAVEPGMTAKEIALLLGEKQLGDTAELLGLIEDRSFAGHLGIKGRGLEGYMFPDIYDLPKGLSGRQLLTRFVERFKQSTEGVKLDGVSGFSEYEVVTVASLIETGAVPPKERRYYARLIYDRIKQRIAISHKPANRYGEARLPPDATESERRSHDWNTSYRAGLPATPVSNPSLSALKAAAHPVDQPVLFRVPREDGTHVFCPDTECYVEAFLELKGRYPRGMPRRFP